MARRQIRTIVVFVLLVFLMSLPGCSAPLRSTANASPIFVHFIDVGQGDSILIQSPEGATALIDGGEANGKALVYLKEHDIKRLDVVILSHPHDDHLGGLLEIINQIPVVQVWTSGASTTTRTFENFLDEIATQEIPYHEAVRGQRIAVGSLDLNVVYSHATSQDLNNTSLVLRLAYGQVAFLFMGDVEALAEKEILNDSTVAVDATVLKIGHHGSESSSTLDFLKLVHPQIAIYSAGLNNQFGHPDASTIANFKAIRTTVYGTDIHGTIVVETNGTSIQINPTNNRPPLTRLSPPHDTF